MRMLADAGVFHEFDVSPDGQRFLLGMRIGEPKAPPPTVILNGTAALEEVMTCEIRTEHRPRASVVRTILDD